MHVTFMGATDYGAVSIELAGSGYKCLDRALFHLNNKGTPHLDRFALVSETIPHKRKNLLQIDILTEGVPKWTTRDTSMVMINGKFLKDSIQNIPLLKEIVGLFKDSVQNNNKAYTASEKYILNHGFVKEMKEPLLENKKRVAAVPICDVHKSEKVADTLLDMADNLEQTIISIQSVSN